jgi:hypothetical protein
MLIVQSEAIGPSLMIIASMCVKHGFNSILPPFAWHPLIDMSKYQHKKHNVSPCIITKVLSSTLVWILIVMYTIQNPSLWQLALS